MSTTSETTMTLTGAGALAARFTTTSHDPSGSRVSASARCGGWHPHRAWLASWQVRTLWVSIYWLSSARLRDPIGSGRSWTNSAVILSRMAEQAPRTPRGHCDVSSRRTPVIFITAHLHTVLLRKHEGRLNVQRSL